MKLWSVDIRFCPACCMHDIEAESAEEAERIVIERLSDGTLFPTEEQKAAMMDTLLENVESVECAGPSEQMKPPAKKRYGIKSYGSWEYFNSEREYRVHLKEWIASTEGAERDRAVNALCALDEGQTEFDSDR